MESKNPHNNKRFSGDCEQSGPTDRAIAPKNVAARVLIKSIAGALQIPEATFYDLQDTSSSILPTRPARTNSISLDDQCDALLKAFRSIDSLPLRNRLLSLVQAAAKVD